MNPISIEVIQKGMSVGKKYKVMDATGAAYLCRLFPKDQYDSIQQDYSYLQKFLALDIPMCKPIEFGTYKDHAYILQTWIDGFDIQETIHTFSEQKQYELGVQSGVLLQKIHSLPIAEPPESWEEVFRVKINNKIHAYEYSKVQIAGGHAFLEYIENNRHWVKNRPRVWLHGDYHLGNLIVDSANVVYAIDFNRGIPCDPWEDFDRISICARSSPSFASGMIHGYFNENVPEIFWKLLTLYTSSKMISFLTWSQYRDDSCVNLITSLSNDVLQWYHNMISDIPSWYFPP